MVGVDKTVGTIKGEGGGLIFKKKFKGRGVLSNWIRRFKSPFLTRFYDKTVA